MKKVFLLMIFVIFLGSCAAAYLPTAEDLNSKKALSPQTDKTVLNQGRALIVGNCASCHRMIYPQEVSLKGWKHILPDMAKRSGLNLSELEKVELYISAVKQAEKEKP